MPQEQESFATDWNRGSEDNCSIAVCSLTTFVDGLQAVTDADASSIFDSTVIVQAAEIGFDHTHIDIPFLVLAGDKTPLKVGQYGPRGSPGATMHLVRIERDTHGMSQAIDADTEWSR